MIPKTIHYCWFGRGKKPYLIRKCLESWRQIMPDYEIKEWNEDNFDINAIPFVKQAYEEKKWAFVADVCRFYACYNEGGIYLDTDVEVFKRFDCFLNNHFFAGTEYQHKCGYNVIWVDASVFGCEKGHWYAKNCLMFYYGKHFRSSDGKITGDVVQSVATNILKPHGYECLDICQDVKDVKIYSTNFFTNKTHIKDKDQLYSLHYFDGSWTDFSKRGWLYKTCRKYDLMKYYALIEKILK